MMEQLQQLFNELTKLAQQQQWERVLGYDTEVRQAVKDFMINHSMTGSKQGEEYLRGIHEVYEQGIKWLESNKHKSATEMKDIQKGLSAAKSYLDLTRY